MAEIMGRDQVVEHASKYFMKAFGLPEEEARTRANDLLATLAEQGDLVQPGTHRPWAFLLRGLLAVAIGLLFLSRPGSALLIVVLTFGAWVFIDGVLALGAAFEGRGSEWRLWISGVVGLAIGVQALLWPALTTRVFLIAVAVWALVRGISEVSAGIGRRRAGRGEGLMILSGVLSLAFGVLLLVMPNLGATLVVWMLAIYAIADGLVLVGLSLRVRHLEQAVGGMRAWLRPEPRRT